MPLYSPRTPSLSGVVPGCGVWSTKSSANSSSNRPQLPLPCTSSVFRRTTAIAASPTDEFLRWRPDSCGNSERLFRSPLPMPCRDGQQSWTCVIPVSERSFADRSGLVEIHVTRATSGEDLRRQLDGVRRQVRINAAAIEVGGELHLQAALF